MVSFTPLCLPAAALRQVPKSRRGREVGRVHMMIELVYRIPLHTLPHPQMIHLEAKSQRPKTFCTLAAYEHSVAI